MDNHKIGQHISEQFNKELEDIRNRVLTMGGLVEQQIDLAIKAFTSGDEETAELVIKQDDQIDALEMLLDRECMQILALRQPAAFDLRLLISVIKIINELERAGDKAERIAKNTLQITKNAGSSDHYYELQHIADMVKGMLHDALDAFARLNIDSMAGIIAQDENVNREYASIIRQLITQMMEDPRNITRSLDIIGVARALERIGDHACDICEYIIYMVNGEDVRHISKADLEKKIIQSRGG